MSPSKHTNNPHSSGYESEPERFLTHSNTMTAKALIHGMTDEDRIREWLNYESRNQSRREVIALLNQQLYEDDA